MDYKNLHRKFVEYFKSTDAKTRIKSRNVDDGRLNDKSIYVEVHHIIPRSIGGMDHPDNLVVLLPEEHIFIHMLRYKAFGCREDILAVRFMLNAVVNRNSFRGLAVRLTKKIRAGYSFVRRNAATVRKTHGWQSPDGIERIRSARLGKMLVKDSVTGERISDYVSVNHPNVVSGKWVHHSKGRKQSRKEIEYKRELYKGQKNPNASGLGDEYFIEKSFEIFKEYDIIPSWANMLSLSKNRNFPWIKSLKSRFGGRGMLGYIDAMEKKTGRNYKARGIRIKINA